MVDIVFTDKCRIYELVGFDLALFWYPVAKWRYWELVGLDWSLFSYRLVNLGVYNK